MIHLFVLFFSPVRVNHFWKLRTEIKFDSPLLCDRWSPHIQFSNVKFSFRGFFGFLFFKNSHPIIFVHSLLSLIFHLYFGFQINELYIYLSDVYIVMVVWRYWCCGWLSRSNNQWFVVVVFFLLWLQQQQTAELGGESNQRWIIIIIRLQIEKKRKNN